MAYFWSQGTESNLHFFIFEKTSRMLFNFCPRCTSDKLQTENNYRVECHHCGFTYFHNVAAAVAVVLKFEDKILFTVRNNDPDKGKLDLPGGFVDPGERGEVAACRELKEELGLQLDVRKMKYVTSAANNYLYKTVPYKTLDLFFEYELDSAEITIFAHDEIQDIQWIDPKTMDLDAIGFISIRTVIEEGYCN